MTLIKSKAKHAVQYNAEWVFFFLFFNVKGG